MTRKKFEVLSLNDQWMAFIYANDMQAAIRAVGNAFPSGGVKVRPCLGVRTGADSTLLVIFERQALQAWAHKSRHAAIRCQATGQLLRDLQADTSPWYGAKTRSLQRARFGAVRQAMMHRKVPSL